MSDLHLSVLLNGDRIVSLPAVSPTIDVGTIKMIVASETNVSSASLVLLYKQAVLTDSQTLGAVGVQTNEMLEARTGGPPRAQPVSSAGAAGSSGSSGAGGRSSNSLGIPDAMLNDPHAVREFLRSNQSLLFSIEAQNPQLYQAILMNDIAPFASMWRQIAANIEAERKAEQERFRLANADPMDPEVQARIAEEIRLKNVQENYEMAVEYNPEAFARVQMLYIPMSVNGVALQAFVDSGAQSTIMSVECAERSGIMRLIDKRFAGVAKGVGSAKILGRVHQVPCTIGKVHVSMSFTILENQSMPFLLGLDQLKSHQAIIDLGKNVLCIQGQEIGFLAEKDLPSEKFEDEEELTDPSRAASAPAPRSTGSSSAAAAAQPARATASPPAAAPAGQSAASAAAVAAAQRRVDAAAAAAAATASSAAAIAAAPRPAAAAAAAPVATPAVAVAVAAPPAAAATPYAPTPAQIAQLTDLGFSQAESVAALVRFAGNADLAAGFLFSS